MADAARWQNATGLPLIKREQLRRELHRPHQRERAPRPQQLLELARASHQRVLEDHRDQRPRQADALLGARSDRLEELLGGAGETKAAFGLMVRLLVAGLVSVPLNATRAARVGPGRRVCGRDLPLIPLERNAARI